MKVYNSTQNSLIADKVNVADNFFTRTFGLIPKKFLSEGEGLIIKPCCSIHTFFMRFPIDVVFVDKNDRVIALYENVRPCCILPIHLKSYYVIELSIDTVNAKNIKKDDMIQFVE